MFGLIGGSIGLSLSIILRLELALPGFIICSSIQYNSSITFLWHTQSNSSLFSHLNLNVIDCLPIRHY